MVGDAEGTAAGLWQPGDRQRHDAERLGEGVIAGRTLFDAAGEGGANEIHAVRISLALKTVGADDAHRLAFVVVGANRVVIIRHVRTRTVLVR